MNGGQHTASELVRLEISEVEAHVDELKEAIRQEVSRGKIARHHDTSTLKFNTVIYCTCSSGSERRDRDFSPLVYQIGIGCSAERIDSSRQLLQILSTTMG